MPDLSNNRCYVYSFTPIRCKSCLGPLIKKEYYIHSKKGKLILFRGKYCPKCNAYAIKYGTYTGQRNEWNVLNGQELQTVAREYANRTKKVQYPQFKNKSRSSNSPRTIYYDVPGLSEKREEERVSRNKAAKGRRAREEREKEKRDEIKRRLESKEEKRIRQLQEFEKKREKEYQRRLAESRARHAAKKREEKQARKEAIGTDSKRDAVSKTTGIMGSRVPAEHNDGAKYLSSNPSNMRKNLISRGTIITSENGKNTRLKPSNLRNKNGDHIITAHDFVVRRTIFKCKHNNHKIEDVKAIFTTISRFGTVNKITIPAGYCATCNMYFIMESTYKRIKKSGIPICWTMDEKSFLKNNTSGTYYNGLASESVLMQFGYNVSQQDDLPAEQRRRILAAIVDNGVLKRNEVVSYLDYFMNQRKSQKNKDGSLRYKDAMDKWRADRAWINQYKLGSYKEVVIGSVVDG